MYEKAFDKYKKAVEYGGRSYNLACMYALKKEKENALTYLNISLSKTEINVDFVEKDEDWKEYFEDIDFIKLLDTYKE